MSFITFGKCTEKKTPLKFQQINLYVKFIKKLTNLFNEFSKSVIKSIYKPLKKNFVQIWCVFNKFMICSRLLNEKTNIQTHTLCHTNVHPVIASTQERERERVRDRDRYCSHIYKRSHIG